MKLNIPNGTFRLDDIYLNQFKIKTLEIPNNFLNEIDTEREHSILIDNLEKKNEIIYKSY